MEETGVEKSGEEEWERGHFDNFFVHSSDVILDFPFTGVIAHQVSRNTLFNLNYSHFV